MQWMPVGLCFWLQCSWVSCEVESSLKIGHYNPDFVVSSYHELGRNPWRDMQAVLAKLQRNAANGVLGQLGNFVVGSAGRRTEGSEQRRDHKNLVFREADVIGHPALALPVLGGVQCQSQAQAFMPYFLSAADALAWRQPAPEIFYPASVIPGLRELGDWPKQTWGSVFPRTGWSIQSEGPKAAALSAQRAGDIVTRHAQPHVYLPLSDPESHTQRIWPPGALDERDDKTGYWQMLAPVVETDCQLFGKNDLDDAVSWSGDRVDEHGDYLWNLWRPYQCCERKGQLFLFDLNWLDYPP